MELEQQQNHQDPPKALPIIVIHKHDGLLLCLWDRPIIIVSVGPSVDIPVPLHVKGLFFR